MLDDQTKHKPTKGSTMARLNITLDQEEILQLLANDKEAAFAKLLQACLNDVLKAESAA